jgi:hypothetical protein
VHLGFQGSSHTWLESLQLLPWWEPPTRGSAALTRLNNGQSQGRCVQEASNLTSKVKSSGRAIVTCSWLLLKQNYGVCSTAGGRAVVQSLVVECGGQSQLLPP